MKKKSTSNSKETGEKKPIKRIDNYFGSAPKPFVIEKIGDPQSTKTLFVQKLHDKLNGESFLGI